MANETRHPATVAAAVSMLMTVVPSDQLDLIAKLDRSELSRLHFGLGMWIRNNLGLWEGNHALLKDAGAEEADGASGVIIYALWEQLRSR